MPKISAKNLREHTELQRRKLLDAGYTLLRARGYAGVSLSDIGTTAGLARNSVYKYFKGKDELLYAALMPRIEAVLVAHQDKILAERDPIERMMLWKRLTIEFIGGPDHELVELMSMIPLAQDRLRRRMLEVLDPLIKQLRSDFAVVMDGSGMTPELWIQLFDQGSRAAGRYGHARNRLAAVADEVVKVVRAFLRFRYQPNGQIADVLPSSSVPIEFVSTAPPPAPIP